MSTAVYIDTETSGLIENGVIPDLFCAVVCSDTGEKTYYAGDPTMTQEQTDKLVMQLCGASRVFTFNGASFDLRVIAAHASDRLAEQVAALAVSEKHIDVMYDFASRSGYFAALSSFSTDHSTPKSMSGATAASKWLDPTARDDVLSYCANDTDMLRAVVRCAQQYGRYERTAKSGRTTSVVIEDFVLRDPLEAYEAHSLLDLTWMNDPPDLSDGFSWALLNI